MCCRPGLESLYAESQRTRYTVDFHKAPFTGLGLTFASHPETGEVGHKLRLHVSDNHLASHVSLLSLPRGMLSYRTSHESFDVGAVHCR